MNGTTTRALRCHAVCLSSFVFIVTALSACGDRGEERRAAEDADRPGVAHPHLWPKTKSAGLVDAATEQFIAELMARMTLEEKVGQMIQADIGSIKPEDLRTYPLGSILAGGSSPPLNGEDRSPPQPWIDTARAFREVSFEPKEGRVTIPILFGIDAVHGHSNVVGATVFPHNIGLGATRDPELIRRIGIATAIETAAAGADWAFGPTLTVPQDDRWGRTYEGYAESPDVVREFARAMVIGLQGEPGKDRLIANGSVAASAKHFLADGGTKDGIDQGNADIDEEELIRIHAVGYPPAIEAGVLTVMVSYSSWQGVKNHGNKSLITDVLKGRMGFEGFVVSDWNGHSQIPGCSDESCPQAINAGIDMLMAPSAWKGLYENTLQQAKSGEIPLERIDDAVRRILRVKAKLGLFEPERPYEGRDVFATAEHRAIAREAVRKSLVLLKNNGRVLPIKGNARVLIAGSGADDIGQACGGWTLSWQGTGNTNKDFPNGESIYAGIRDALRSFGGQAELSVDGKYKKKPDVAVVVFGEQPYAEMQGDIKTLEYQAGDKLDLELLKRLKADGIPVVSVFLSGRPLWVNPELNASDAFVAAWLPGTEGGGVADVIVGDRDGKPRHDFVGKLSFSWPKSAAQTQLNFGKEPYDPLFPFGYGLTYNDSTTVPQLDEVSGVDAADWNVDQYYRDGRERRPWKFELTNVTMDTVDAGGVQEAGRRFTWGGGTGGTVAVVGNEAIDLKRQANGDLSLFIEYRVDERPSAPVQLSMRCGEGCASNLDVTEILNGAKVGEMATLKVKLVNFRDTGADMGKITHPFVMTTNGKLQLTIKTLRLVSDPAGTTTLGTANSR
jgi:beta-glucosidase